MRTHRRKMAWGKDAQSEVIPGNEIFLRIPDWSRAKTGCGPYGLLEPPSWHQTHSIGRFPSYQLTFNIIRKKKICNILVKWKQLVPCNRIN